MLLEVLHEQIDFIRQERHLHSRGAGIGLMGLMLADEFLLGSAIEHGYSREE